MLLVLSTCLRQLLPPDSVVVVVVDLRIFDEYCSANHKCDDDDDYCDNDNDGNETPQPQQQQ